MEESGSYSGWRNTNMEIGNGTESKSEIGSASKQIISLYVWQQH